MTRGTKNPADKPLFIDSHAHLELEPLVYDPESVVRRAEDAGVVGMITVGINLEDVERALEIADRFDPVFASVGFHPHNAKEVGSRGLQRMEALAAHPKVVAYGEIGLDFFRNHSPRSVQKAVFRDQIFLAKSLGKPVVIHLRNAYPEGLDMLEESAPFPAGGVIHCFSGDAADAERALKLGFHISIPGTITYKKNDAFRSIVRELPANRILLETDCPFLSPEPLRGKTNEPANMVHTAERVALVRGVPLVELGRTTAANAIGLFGLPEELLSPDERSSSQ
jgi:TatD DNase family protein